MVRLLGGVYEATGDRTGQAIEPLGSWRGGGSSPFLLLLTPQMIWAERWMRGIWRIMRAS
jgi:hypothetical protein